MQRETRVELDLAQIHAKGDTRGAGPGISVSQHIEGAAREREHPFIIVHGMSVHDAAAGGEV